MPDEIICPTCPTCGGDLDAHSRGVVDTDGDALVVNCVGRCAFCGNRYHWFEEYELRKAYRIKALG